MGKIDFFAPKVIAAIFMLTLFCATTFAQKQNRYFYGKVIDRETKYPIASANITFTGSGLGSSTNSKGEFSFFIDTIPVYMTVSHLGYEPNAYGLTTPLPLSP